MGGKRSPRGRRGLGAVLPAIWLASFVTGAVVAAPTPAVPAPGEGARDRQSDRSRIERSTPEATVGSGRASEQWWRLTAYSGHVRGGGFSGSEVFCTVWARGDGPAVPSSTCLVDFELTADDAMRVSADRSTRDFQAFFGQVRDDVTAVEILLEDGSTRTAQVISAPEVLRVAFDFFVGFVPPHQDVTLVAYDQSGRAVSSESWPALPLLSVRKTGSGEGVVRGFSTEELSCVGVEFCPAPEVRWIDCGSDCAAQLDGASITLVATPREGAAFIGWSGECEGMEPCELDVERDMNVTATFESAP